MPPPYSIPSNAPLYAAYGAFALPRRRKTDWAGVGLGDAFKPTLDYVQRLAAQRLFYQTVQTVQRTVAQATGATQERDLVPQVKPQLTPCYTTYPATLAAGAAIGLTAYLECEERLEARLLWQHLQDFLDNPSAYDHTPVDPEAYKTLARLVTESVQTRLLLEDLSRHPGLHTVESYRLFAASQQAFPCRSLAAIVHAVVLYGDILPTWHDLNLPTVSRAIFADLSMTCQPYLARLPQTALPQLVDVGIDWVLEVCVCLLPYLPLLSSPSAEGITSSHKAPDQASTATTTETGTLAPLEAPPSLTLEETSDVPAQILEALGPGAAPRLEAPAVEAISAFAAAVEQAGGQAQQHEDLRGDLVEEAIRLSGFGESAIQGNPTNGQEVQVHLGNNEMVGGEIFDRPIALSDDLSACEQLCTIAQPLTAALQRTLYPSREQVPATERWRSSGALDPARLALAEVSPAIFTRHCSQQRADRRGQPLLVIACDGSGSLNAAQMQMVKVLCASWLLSTARSRIQVLAGLYHSGTIREGLSAPLIQWIYHPHKTPALGRLEAVQALASLPAAGTGTQADALSLARIMDEARTLARGRMMYLILISDCRYNRSFHTGRNGTEEMRAFFQATTQALGDRLHTTLVAVGVQESTGLEALVNTVITIPQQELSDYLAVASRIGLYVATCMRERQQQLASR